MKSRIKATLFASVFFVGNLIKKQIDSILLLAVAVLISTSMIACDSNGSDDDSDTGNETASGNISGVARDVVTGTPLPGITVTLGSVETTTDNDGRFEFREVPVGTMALGASMTGFDTYTRPVEVQAGDNLFNIPLTRAAPSALGLAFSDAAWDGVTIPIGQQCQRQGGVNPSTPRIVASNIPEGTDAIILEFSDRDFSPMDDGGHGKFGFFVPEVTGEVLIPSVPGHTFNLPEGFFLIQAHQAPDFDTAGAYMPPCSGAIGNSYYVTVKAVKVFSEKVELSHVLGLGVLELGRY